MSEINSSQGEKCGECGAENGWHRTVCLRHPRFTDSSQFGGEQEPRCPFCGGSNYMTVPNNATGLARQFATHCTRCRASGPPCGSEAYAEESWNTRQLNQPTDKIIVLARDWARVKEEYYRFGREEYAHKVSPLYAEEHNLSPEDAASLRTAVRSTLESLDKAEHKAQWALYEKLKEQL
jgi:hypothetical protein